jgi:hypothetical protein
VTAALAGGAGGYVYAAQGHSSDADPRDAEAFGEYELYFLGASKSQRHADSVDLIYGDCDPAPCAPPLQIQIWPICERNPSLYRATPESDGPIPHATLTIRGVPAASYHGGTLLEVYTGDVAVAIFGERGQARRGAAALRPLNRLAATGPRLPEPAPGVRGGRGECRPLTAR